MGRCHELEMTVSVTARNSNHEACIAPSSIDDEQRTCVSGHCYTDFFTTIRFGSYHSTAVPETSGGYVMTH